jgi:hypothetical protein
VVLVMAASIVFLFYLDHRRTDCMERYNTAATEVQRKRAEAQADDWAALDALVRDIHDGKPFSSRAQEYLDTRDRTLQKRAENPLAPPAADAGPGGFLISQVTRVSSAS